VGGLIFSAKGMRCFQPHCPSSAIAAKDGPAADGLVSKRSRRPPLVGALLLWLATSAIAAGAGAESDSSDISTSRLETLRSLDLEDLLHAEVTSVSKRPEAMFDSAAAIFVITAEDIRRSGARNIPEALRLAPGVNVARIDANKWAVATRGFNDRFTGQLLVLIDGRSVYSPLNSGVFWDAQDYVLEDIERIEVIRGPGGALWGANAVSGVINIITKSAKDTVGGYASGGYGSEARGFGDFRYGLKLAEDWYGRWYFKYKNQDAQLDGRDDWDFMQGGFRVDWEHADYRLTVQGDCYAGTIHHQQVIPQFTAPYLPVFDEEFEVFGGNALTRFTRQFSEESELQVQAYFDRAKRTETAFGNVIDTYDIDFQHRFPLPLRQNFMYGVGYRYMTDRYFNREPLWLAYDPQERGVQVFGGFVNDEIELVQDRLKLTLGTKLEHNDYTAWEVQPNARIAWTPTYRQTVWAAVSRAVQIPGRSANDIHVLLPVEPVPAGAPPLPPFPMFIQGNGNPEIESLELLAYELGYRIQPTDRLSFDVAGFYNSYRNFSIGQEGTPYYEGTPTPHLIFPLTTINGASGETYGVEISSDWRVMDGWRLSGSYSFLEVQLDGFSSGTEGEGKDPQNNVTLRSSMDLPWNLQLDLWGRYVDQLPAYNIPGYFDLDARLGWRPRKYLELAIVGQNLLDASRLEFEGSDFDRTIATQVQRGVYLEVSIRF
jgi:iron complex outermembrane receptor protein